jgi:hypothetical protein
MSQGIEILPFMRYSRPFQERRGPMTTYIIRRILVFIPMLLGLTIIVFALIQAAPGDPFSGRMVDPRIDPKSL